VLPNQRLEIRRKGRTFRRIWGSCPVGHTRTLLDSFWPRHTTDPYRAEGRCVMHEEARAPPTKTALPGRLEPLSAAVSRRGRSGAAGSPRDSVVAQRNTRRERRVRGADRQPPAPRRLIAVDLIGGAAEQAMELARPGRGGCAVPAAGSRPRRTTPAAGGTSRRLASAAVSAARADPSTACPVA
jgi:hypothetical protein